MFGFFLWSSTVSSSSSSASVSTGPLSPTILDDNKKVQRIKTSEVYTDNESEDSLLEQSMKRSSLGSISPSSVLLNFSLASLPRNGNHSTVSNKPTEKTLEIRTPSPSPLQTANTNKPIVRPYSQQTVKETSSMTTTHSLEEQITQASSSNQSQTYIADKCNGLFDRFLKNYSSTCTGSVLDEPEISFVSNKSVSVTSNPTSPTKTTTMTTSTKTNSFSTTSLSNGTLKQQKQELSAQFEHMSPIETTINRRFVTMSLQSPSIEFDAASTNTTATTVSRPITVNNKQ